MPTPLQLEQVKWIIITSANAQEVFKKLRGRKGTAVDVTISRIGSGKPFDVTIIRDDIPIYSVGAATMIDDITGYVSLRRFSATTEKEVSMALDKLNTAGMKRLIFYCQAGKRQRWLFIDRTNKPRVRQRQ